MKIIRLLILAAIVSGVAQAGINDRIEYKQARLFNTMSNGWNFNAPAQVNAKNGKKQKAGKKAEKQKARQGKKAQKKNVRPAQRNKGRRPAKR